MRDERVRSGKSMGMGRGVWSRVSPGIGSMHRWSLLAGVVAAVVVTGCATGPEKAQAQAQTDTQPASTPAATAKAPAPTKKASSPAADQNAKAAKKAPPARKRRARAGAMDDSAFRDPFGFHGTNIFAPLDWPDPDMVRNGAGAPGKDYWQQQVDYDIDAALDVDAKSISATATVTYHNNSPDALSYLWLHLEQNLFKADSNGSLSTEPGSRFGYREGFKGGYDIDYLKAEGKDLPLFVYDTMGRVDLPKPIPSGATYTFQIGWHFSLPPFGADRMGMDTVEDGTIFEIAQWFPALATYDDVHGWNTMGYLGQGEFYTEYGDYNVNITVPRSHIVVSSGILQNPEDVLTEEEMTRYHNAKASDKTVIIRSADEIGDPDFWPIGAGPMTWRYSAKQVRTFAWASSRAFIWDGAGLDVPGSAQAVDGRVFVQAVYPREAQKVWSGAVQMARHSIGFNSKKWHPFAYPVAVNVNGTVGGMEYPGIVFCGARTNKRGLYGVTDHEFGHNWFPMLVNSDERRYAWMDEGFNTFFNIYTKQDYFHEDPAGGRAGAAGQIRSQSRPNQQPMMTYPDNIWRGRLGYLAYGKPAAALWQLRENVLGHERFDRAFREYIDRWAFKHPQPSDFFRTIEDVAGMDLAWFWRGWFYSTATSIRL